MQTKSTPPGVDADGDNLQSAPGYLAQSAYDFEIEGMDVPVVMTALLNEVIGEAGHLLKGNSRVLSVESCIVDAANDGTSAGGAQVDGEKIFLLFHDVCD